MAKTSKYGRYTHWPCNHPKSEGDPRRVWQTPDGICNEYLCLWCGDVYWEQPDGSIYDGRD